MQQENERMKLKDGRTLSYAVYGSPVPQKTIVFMHGCQSSRYEGKLWHSACALHNVRIIAPRPSWQRPINLPNQPPYPRLACRCACPGRPPQDPQLLRTGCIWRRTLRTGLREGDIEGPLDER